MNVYADITNTYRTRLNTGVQRVTRELLWRLLDGNNDPGPLNIVPIVYYDRVRLWKRISRREFASLYTGRNAPLASRLSKPLSPLFWASLMRQVPAGSVFLDMDSSWHSPLARRVLFKDLHDSGTAIVRLHYDIVPVRFPGFCHEKTVQNYLRHLAACLTYASLFVCISRHAEEELLNLVSEQGLSRGFETRVLGLGADFGMGTERSRGRGGRKDTGFDSRKEREKYLLCVGTLEPRKNHSVLIDAFERIHGRYPWVKLVLVGKEGWDVDGLVRRIREHPLCGKELFWLTGVSDEALKSLYEHCILTVVPSIYEGYGLSVAESLMKGKVTICSTGGSLPEVGGGYADYFDPTDSRALEDLITGYLDSPKRRGEREREIRRFRPFTWDQSARDLREILEEFIPEWKTRVPSGPGKR